ncbi:hypothetical protein B5F34_10675 [Mediterranea sp. An20]|uniref:fimbrillin family protein n=1 Tax=Mediterranea sp. An20 TaxID=1965586 RepID=UPI000B3918F1|nr:fimbrillin family protein [Mediterranea sp. An20]OUP07607.1 hypothetical protein B5F34_10675 [Mediterranea sp. An20]
MQTRAASGIQGSAFDEGESVDIFITEAVEADESATTTYPQPLTYTTGTNGTMTPPTGGQPYFPTSGNGVNIYAYYPSGAVTDMGASGVAFTVKTDQSTDAAYKASDLMFGTAANPVSRQSSAIPVTFRHLLSKITVNLTSGDGNPSLDGATVSLMNVRLDAQLTPSDGTVAEGTGTQDESVTVTTGTGGSAIIPVQTVASGKQFIRVQLQTGGKLYYTLPQNATFQGGKVYTYNIKVNLTDLEVTSSITDWTTDGDYSGDSNGEANM